uniref:hypothetical protein n=1 Tax=Ningiella ruwaisensis TaxID=2364274 RepID=UPI00109F8B95|nr:hypothetical protein [Ningiella ruwaisensis]
MSVAKLARAGRIDSEVSRLINQASSINSQLNSVVNEVLAFAAFMNTNTNDEFTQDDRDKYSDEFNASLAALNATMQKLMPLAAIESGDLTVADFLASYTGDVVEYSKRFDRA